MGRSLLLFLLETFFHLLSFDSEVSIVIFCSGKRRKKILKSHLKLKLSLSEGCQHLGDQ